MMRSFSLLPVLIMAATATISQNRLFSDNMILESREAYDIRPFVSGFGTTPGETVVVTFDKQSYPTTVGTDGNWEVQMNCCDYLTDQTLEVKGQNNTLTYTNVACGQVFVCSGQSNMELPLSYVNGGAAEIAKANKPNWRLFRVPHTTADTPQDDMVAEDGGFTKLPATWLVSNSTIAAKFSATCFLTAKHISEMLWGDAPIGLIWASWGGTRVEAWATLASKKACPSAAAEKPYSAPQAYSSLYNGMIHPLTKFSIRGAFWFQGEHNVVTHNSQESYACIFEEMINDWRDAWQGIGDFPFMWAQLSAYTGYAPFPGHGDISVVRLAQANDMPKLGLDTTGMAVTFDQGDPTAPEGDVHSRNKDPVAYRLALQAMHVAYAFQEGENVTNINHPNLTPNPFELHFSGPIATNATVSGDTVSVAFEHGEQMFLNDTFGCEIHRGINFNGQPIGGDCCKAKDTFQLCTGDLMNTTGLACVNASSTISDAGVQLEVPRNAAAVLGAAVPTSVRYAYANYPQCALLNKYKLPASPFVLKVAAAKPNKAVELTPVKVASAGVALTPPMGINSWNAFHCNVDERKIRAMADAVVTSGLAKAGYEFINIDDCWQVARTRVGPDQLFNGSITADPERFPQGMKSLADYIHNKGLKFGIYSAQREFTCQRRPGSWQHEAIDVASYCEWGVDYLKLDACAGRGWDQKNTSWIKFRAAIDECSKTRGTPMVLSVESCDDPTGCGMWVGKLANLWRTSRDIQATFASVMSNVAHNTKMAMHAGPTGGPLGGGHWNDADMLQVGNIGLSVTEQRSHYALWAFMASPLLIGSDVSVLSNTSLSILGNVEVAAVNQDAIGAQGVPIQTQLKDPSTASCWTKPMKDGSTAVILLNVGDATSTVSCKLSDLNIKAGAKNVRDLWLKKDLGPPGGDSLNASLASHDHKLFLVK